MEPLRAAIDRLVLRLVGLQQIRPEHFQESAQGIILASEARKACVQTFARMVHGDTTHGLAARIEQLTGTYRRAVLEDVLGDWTLPPQT